MIVNRKSSLRALEIFTWNTLYLLKEEMTFRFLMTIVWHETFNQIVYIISFANSQGTSFHDLSCPSIKRSLFKTPITNCMCHNCINVSNWVIIEIARSSFFQSALNVYCSSFFTKYERNVYLFFILLSPNTSALYIYWSTTRNPGFLRRLYLKSKLF